MDFERRDRLSSANAPTDAQLWHSCQNSADALGELYDRHAGLVYGIALKMLGNRQEAEDLTQDIFVKLAATAYDPRRGSLRTYLAVLTRSRAMDRLRSQQSRRNSLSRLQAASPAPAMDLPEQALEQTERSQEVQAALAQLSESQQQVLRLAYYDGLTQAAIAQRLDTPLGTVKARARRGLLKLRRALEPYMD